MNTLSEILSIRYPLILAPMFVVTNERMVSAAIDSGATGALAAHNYRTAEDLRRVVQNLHNTGKRPFGVNIILDFQTDLFLEYLKVCQEEHVDFVISSLGDPKIVVDACRPLGIKVFSDVVNEQHADKAVARGVDALVAVSNRAGGHAGRLSPEELITKLMSRFDVPVIAAGGVATYEQFQKMVGLGVAGVSVGTPFIATEECDVSEEYKMAIVNAHEKDIVLTKRISGIPITVINTSYIKSLGVKQTWFEKHLKQRKRLRRLVAKGMQNTVLRKYRHRFVGPDYEQVFCAGPVVSQIERITSVSDVINRIFDKR